MSIEILINGAAQPLNDALSALANLAPNQMVARASTGPAEVKPISDVGLSAVSSTAANAATAIGLGVSSLVSHGRLTLTDSSPLITTNTVDGSDNRIVTIIAGGAVSANRGGRIECSGNEATNAGKVRCVPGVADGVTAGVVELCNAGGSAVLTVAAARGLLNGVLALANTTAPTTFPTAGIFAEGGEVKAWDTSGNFTTLSDHPIDAAAEAGVVIDPNDGLPHVYRCGNVYLGVERFDYTDPLTGSVQVVERSIPNFTPRDWDTDQEAIYQQSLAERQKFEAERDAAIARAESVASEMSDRTDDLTEEESRFVLHVAQEAELYVNTDPPPLYTKMAPPQWMRDRGVVSHIAVAK